MAIINIKNMTGLISLFFWLTVYHTLISMNIGVNLLDIRVLQTGIRPPLVTSIMYL